uniref:UPF0102 protein BECKMB1821G_GA0114241_100832 n=1 Tax=Candidatus Kentrum sp. MB TaxID=2138164 RepID=A0A450X4Y3_9GAMM|nr:MAG: putative endonuclease [Candidatus Kentron sp. MB]VFK30658.1 MAG: putative endonuclease [Candidatus Kentron sp. MB]VFK75359.1 MAG: putative endonuclease [Candidatus Kentron sp. MB]
MRDLIDLFGSVFSGLGRKDSKYSHGHLPSFAERGTWAEELAADYLHGKGMKTRDKNYRCKFGEIDLIMDKKVANGETIIVFVEVRFRGSSHFGTGVESVDGRKQQRIIRTARYYLQQNPRLRDKPCRFDIISISPSSRDEGIHWIPAAFDAYVSWL